MSKSIPAILGIGVAACVLLSLMMKHLVEVEAESQRSEYAPALEAKFRSRLVGRVQLRERERADGASWRLFAVVDDERKLAALAADMGRELWFAAMRAGERPVELVVQLQPEGSSEPSEFLVEAPAAPR